MGIFDGCIIACDVDGTFMDNGYINPRNAKSIEYFLSQGGKFSLSTGRSQAALGDVMNAVKTLSPSVLANGTLIYDFDKKEYLFFASLCKEDKDLTKFVCENFPDVGIEIHSGETVFTPNQTEETSAHENYEHFISKKVNLETAEKSDWNKVIYMFCGKERLKAVLPVLEEQIKDSRLVETSVIIDGKRRYYCEQVPNGVSKASSLKRLCEMLKIKKGGFFAIGDYYNDLEMIKNADISACPENAPEDVKQFATVTVCSVHDGAVADFIEYLKNNFQSERK